MILLFPRAALLEFQVELLPLIRGQSTQTTLEAESPALQI